MNKKFCLLCLSLLATLSFAACNPADSSQSGSSDSQSQSSNVESSDTGSSNVESSDVGGEEVETHDYVLHEEVAGTCSTAGVIAHYTCNDCDKLFDLLKNEIESTAGELDAENHSADVVLVAQTQPTKLVYAIGEEFDATGMTVAYKCADCDGEIIDNQFLSFAYQTEGATAFAAGDTKITVSFNDVSFDVEVTVSKLQAQLSNVEETYTTACGVAPTVDVKSNAPDAPINVTYYDGETEITAEDFVAGKTYTVKFSIASTDTMDGTEATASVVVEHARAWAENKEDWKKLEYVCKCGDAAEFYAMNYQSPYVDTDNLGIDLSQFIVGAESVEVKSVKRVVRMLDNTYVAAADGTVEDIKYTNDGFVYSFAADTYEKPSGEYKPFILTLSVDYLVDGVECSLYVEAKLVDKLIQEKEDLLTLAYKGAATAGEGGVAENKYYVLTNDIDASGLTLDASNPAWQDAIGFRGIFEGNGHTISNLSVPGWHNGLFGAVGDGAKIQNVNFTNVTMGQEAGLFALVLRKAMLSNVNVEFDVASTSFLLANTANDSTFSNVNVTTCIENKPFVKVGDVETALMPEGITYSYHTYFTVSFDTDGGNAIDAQSVTEGRRALQPATPVKTAEEYVYTFLGWYNGETEWDFANAVTEDVALVAKWRETKKANAADVVALIEALPSSVTMLPAQIYYVPAIRQAKAEYDKLDVGVQAEVTNYAKLEELLAKIQGYETVYVPAAGGVKAVPAVTHAAAGTTVSGSFATDETYGATFISTANEGGKAAIQFANFPSVAAYDKIYFYARSSVAGKLYMADDGENDGWGSQWKNNSGSINDYNIGTAWTLMSLDVSTGIIDGDWMMSIWGGGVNNQTLEVAAVIGCKSAELPAVDKVAVNLTFGKMVDSGETNDYGQVYNISREQWFVDENNTNTIGTLQTNKLANALPSGFDHFEFWMYNPTDIAYNFHLAGDCSGTWTDSADSITLAAGAWTKVTISAEDVELNKQGQWYVYIQGGDGAGAAADGWKISTIYAVKA